MASFRSKFTREYIHVVKRFIVKGEKYKDIGFLRSGFEKLAKRIKLPKYIYFKRFFIGDMEVAWIAPPKADHKAVMLYLHGGGYITGSINTHKAMVSRIARASKVRALLINYRLAPENPYPAALEDAVTAYKWLLEKGYEPENIIIAGDSAGGGLTLTTLLYIKDNHLPMPATAVCLSPLTDLEGKGDSFWKNDEKDPMIPPEGVLNAGRIYALTTDLDDPYVSPVHADFTGFPPLLIQVGTDEVLLDDSVRVKKKAEKQGVEVHLEVWKDMFHVFQFAHKYIPESKAAIAKIALHIQHYIKSQKYSETDI